MMHPPQGDQAHPPHGERPHAPHGQGKRPRHGVTHGETMAPPHESGVGCTVTKTWCASVRGEAHAFDQLVERYFRGALAVALEYARHRDDAEDIVQEASSGRCASYTGTTTGSPFAPGSSRSCATNISRWCRCWSQVSLPPFTSGFFGSVAAVMRDIEARICLNVRYTD